MSHARIANIVLYITLGITIPLMALFYFGNSPGSDEAYELKLQRAERSVQKTRVPDISEDLKSAESLGHRGGEDKQAEQADELRSAMTEKPGLLESMFYHRLDISLIWAYILLVIAALAALAFPLVRGLRNPRQLLRNLVITAVAALLVVACWILSSGKPVEIIGYSRNDSSDPSILRLIDTGLYLSYLMIGLVILAVVYSEISAYFKKTN
jgi:hypothetical protein